MKLIETIELYGGGPGSGRHCDPSALHPGTHCADPNKQDYNKVSKRGSFQDMMDEWALSRTFIHPKNSVAEIRKQAMRDWKSGKSDKNPLLKAISSAPINNKMMFRGMVLKTTDPLLKKGIGDTVVFGPSSFSVSKSVATDFGSKTYGSVLIQVKGGNSSVKVTSQWHDEEKEFISAGAFKIENIKMSGRTKVITMSQTGVL